MRATGTMKGEWVGDDVTDRWLATLVAGGLSRALEVIIRSHNQFWFRFARGILAKKIGTLGVRANEPAPSDAFPVENLKTEADVLAFAADREQGAVNSHLGAVGVRILIIA